MRTGLRARRFNSYLALFAFVIQFSFAFGHVELPSLLHHDGLLQQFLERAVTGGPLSTQAGDHAQHNEKHTDSCELCWLQGVAGSATLSAGALATIIAPCVMGGWHAIAEISLPAIELAYRVRAPPAPLTN